MREWCIHAMVDKFCDFETPDEDKEYRGFLQPCSLVSLWNIMKDKCDLCIAFFLQAQDHSEVNLPKDVFAADIWDGCYFHHHSKEEACYSKISTSWAHNSCKRDGKRLLGFGPNLCARLPVKLCTQRNNNLSDVADQ